MRDLFETTDDREVGDAKTVSRVKGLSATQANSPCDLIRLVCSTMLKANRALLHGLRALQKQAAEFQSSFVQL